MMTIRVDDGICGRVFRHMPPFTHNPSTSGLGHLWSLASSCFGDAEVEQLWCELMPSEHPRWAGSGPTLKTNQSTLSTQSGRASGSVGFPEAAAREQ